MKVKRKLVRKNQVKLKKEPKKKKLKKKKPKKKLVRSFYKQQIILTLSKKMVGKACILRLKLF